MRVGEKVGVGRLGWHAFRHTYSTLLNEHGADIKVQQELLRHADIREQQLILLLLPTGT
jgi:integrase